MVYIVYLLTLLLTSSGIVSAAKLMAGRIVNGVQATPGEFPSQLSLQFHSNHNCGASILSERWAVTAAHCVPTIAGLTAVSGTTDLTQPGNIHAVEEAILHPSYNASNSFINDIAVIRVKQPFLIDGKTANPVLLPKQNQETAENSPATAIGWGRFSLWQGTSVHLYKVNILITNQWRCREVYKTYQYHAVYDTMICADMPGQLQGVCKGDSGGPLLVAGELVGITSWEYHGCVFPPYPGVYTRVAAYRDWIRATTGV